MIPNSLANPWRISFSSKQEINILSHHTTPKSAIPDPKPRKRRVDARFVKDNRKNFLHLLFMNFGTQPCCTKTENSFSRPRQNWKCAMTMMMMQLPNKWAGRSNGQNFDQDSQTPLWRNPKFWSGFSAPLWMDHRQRFFSFACIEQIQ